MNDKFILWYWTLINNETYYVSTVQITKKKVLYDLFCKKNHINTSNKIFFVKYYIHFLLVFANQITKKFNSIICTYWNLYYVGTKWCLLLKNEKKIPSYSLTRIILLLNTLLLVLFFIPLLVVNNRL